MFYGKDSIENQFDPLLKKLEEQELFLFEPMPSYKLNEKWTDEFRIRDGHTKLDDGSWVTIHKVTTYVQSIQKSVTRLYEQNQELYKELNLLKQQKYEMEYGLRVAQKSLNTAINMKGEHDNISE
jgi:ABC-type Zn uptake system ZnuABC Zn-binding protein ZnuA